MRRLAAGLLALVAAAASGGTIGVDSGLPTGEALALWRQVSPQLALRDERWMRVREVSLALTPLHGGWVIDPATRGQLRRQLAELRQRKLRIAAFVELQHVPWPGGARVVGRRGLPADLREVFAFAAALRTHFDDVVDIWEVGNEPEIFYPDNAEDYAAVLKAFYLGYHAAGGATSARVVMAPLGRPATRYMESMIQNEALAYTDAFNLHLYGHAEDIRGFFDLQLRVARMAAEEAGRGARAAESLPVFVTELGYVGLLKERAGDAAARERQATWFRRVLEDFRWSRPEALLAFVLKPYVSPAGREMGLATAEGKATPALLDWWRDTARGAREIRFLRPGLPARVPVVVDVRWPGRTTIDRSGKLMRGPVDATLILYNFSREAVVARLDLPGSVVTGSARDTVEIGAGGRVEIPFRTSLVRSSAMLKIAAEGGWGRTEWQTWLRRDGGFADAGEALALDFTAADNERMRQRLVQRKRVIEEPHERPQGRWLATEGVDVVETRDAWRITVRAMPPEAEWRRAVAELVFPEPVAPDDLGNVEIQFNTLGAARTELEVHWRTEKGALFGAPAIFVSPQWQRSVFPWDAFEPLFFGRPPTRWRLAENRFASVIFAFTPQTPLPLTVELRKFSARVRR